ncbi:stereocilin-like [Coregonus clupeaformis]|uniref:stereocilin-like n=1 Tax=Coregonus clupeaformis TaxID=59861 RepID=UPI001E1C483C|nr:stereocilin-like [Coregonus clupeaformis]
MPRDTINSIIRSLSAEQRRAFGRWYSRALSSLNMTAGGPSFIRDTGNLIVYLPFHSFQHLSPAQLLNGMDVLLMNTLSPLQQQFVAESLIGTFRNLTAEQFRRLGNLMCLSDPKDLQVYRNTEAFSVIQDNIRTCVVQGLRNPSDLITSLFLNGSELQSPGSLPAGRVSQLAPFLPWLGVDFLQKLSQSQLSPALTALASVPFTPAQAGVIVDKLSLNNSLALPGQLQKLGSLVSGVKVETLRSLPSDTLLSSLPDIALHTPGLNHPQANTITTKLWGSPEVTGWLDKVEPLLPSTPLISVLTRASLLLTNRTSAERRAWNTQQAKTLFKEAVKTMPNFSTEKFLALGSIARGVSCTALRQLFRYKPSFSSMRSVLAFMKKQSVPLHTSLKKCIIEELYYFDFFSELLGELGSQIALALPVSTIKKFPADMMDTLRKMIVQDPHHFLLLPSTKQDILVDKMVQRLGMYTGEFTEDEFRSLGIMATYVVDEVFVQLVRSFFVESLEFLREFCYNSSKRDIVAQILQEPGTFGPVQNWTPETLNQVDRFIFFLPKEKLQQIPQALMTQGRIERLFLSQRQWESGAVGALCIQGRDQVEQTQLFERQQFVLQYFLGFLKVGRVTPPALIPTCEKLHTTRPSAWSTDSLTGMSSAAFSCSLELFGQDPFFLPYQQKLLLQKTKEIYGAARSFSSSVITQLGRIASQLSVAELSVIRLSELSTISALGAVNTWNSRQLAVLSSSVLNSTQVGPSQLDSSTLVAMGHILCGINYSDMRSLNAVEFSKAVMWLGRLRLACSEEQQQALTGLLSHSLAFGPMSSWGPEVFIEVGALAAGLPDMAMSSLVKEQVEGLTPLAVSLIRADKFAVVFDPAQISMFSYEQAKAVTEAQRSLLSPVQLTAMSMVLTVWDDKPVDFRGSSSGLALCPSPHCHLLGLLMVLLVSAL